jgi:hypothetical protein
MDNVWGTAVKMYRPKADTYKWTSRKVHRGCLTDVLYAVALTFIRPTTLAANNILSYVSSQWLTQQ